MSDTIRITVDGQAANVVPGTPLLEAMSGMGVRVPTLCHHPSVEPSGACRLCTVEISHADWGGWSGLVTSCLYPVQDEGLQVSTLSERVRRTRRSLLELYLARCPDSEEVAALARTEGVDVTEFPPREGADDCVQCGLCLRVCRERSVAALAPLGRGVDKTVGPRPDMAGEDCVGCLACAEVCPTGEIKTRVADGKLEIWNRTFDLALCSVERENCLACGACEEACPLAIPRVAPGVGGEYAATISRATCVGCGLCAGACPTGAVLQREYTDRTMAGFDLAGRNLMGRTVVFACSRSVLPKRADLIPVTCVGRVGVEHILECLARGARGVQLMCRDAETCPYARGGRAAEKRALLSNRLAAVSGLGADRVVWTHPAAGPDGPAEAAAEFRGGLDASPLDRALDDGDEMTGLDRALRVLDWLRERPELARSRLRYRIPVLGGTDRPESEGADTLLYLGDLPDLALLAKYAGAGTSLVHLIRQAAEMLADSGCSFRTVTTRGEIERSDAKRLVVFSRDVPDRLPDLPAELEVVTLAELAEADDDTDATVLDVAAVTGPGFRFRISPTERKQLLDLLGTSDTPLCTSPYELLQLELLTRTGAWQQAPRIAPRLTFERDAATGEARS